MKAQMTRTAMTVTAVALVAALVSPVVATAAPGQLRAPMRNGSAVGAPANAKAKLLENLKKRIANVLHARKARFDAIAANLNLRIDRVSAIANRVEKAGGDVSAARTSIDDAKAHLATAKSREQDAIDAFNAIPSASDRRAAFREARDKARLAREEIKACRDDIRAAARELRTVVAGLKSEATQ